MVSYCSHHRWEIVNSCLHRIPSCSINLAISGPRWALNDGFFFFFCVPVLFYLTCSKLWFHALFLFRAPNPDTVLVIQTPLGVFSTKSMLQNKEKRACSRSIRKDTERQLVLPALNSAASCSSSARCRVYAKMEIKVRCAGSLFLSDNHRLPLNLSFLKSDVLDLPLSCWKEDHGIFASTQNN